LKQRAGALTAVIPPPVVQVDAEATSSLTPQDVQEEVLPRGTSLGRYMVLEKLGEGGNGSGVRRL